MTAYLAMALALAAAQPANPSPTGVSDCDRYVAFVRACLPKMCEEERVMRELELDLALETIAAAVKHRGPQAAGQTCAADIQKEMAEDLYGCHAGSRAAGILVEASGAATSVLLRISGAGVTGAGPLEVSLAAPLVPEPAAVYVVAPEAGAYVIDSASAASGGITGGEVRLESDTPYCYSIATPVEGAPGRGTVLRKGTVWTK
jgi:hypothetical protein